MGPDPTQGLADLEHRIARVPRRVTLELKVCEGDCVSGERDFPYQAPIGCFVVREIFGQLHNWMVEVNDDLALVLGPSIAVVIRTIMVVVDRQAAA